ncbi:MAG: hypothetical protein J6X58_04010 [Bacteroidales bacterium]|nr:hypothetical protein [Bacteroidales bacterium]
MKKLTIILMIACCILGFAQQPERMQGHGSDDEPLNPLSFGLREATDAKARYAVLYACHKEAFERHRAVSYAGIDTIWLEIPDTAKTMPLGYNTDFAGVVFFVRNDSEKDLTLFALSGEQPAKEISIDKALLDSGDFRSISEFLAGEHLLIIRDEEPWTERTGYGYTVWRQDLLYVSNGRSLNFPVTSYSTPAAKPKCSFVPVTTDPKTIQNVTIHRGRNEKHKTYCFSVRNQNNVTLRNIHITTPKTKMNADGAISLNNCSNCTIQDVTVDSTYSYKGAYGYALSMNNVWNTTFIRFKADAAWGVFGSNNVSKTTLRECDVNRFDIHCYGRDAYLVNCVFRNKQTQFSSMYGKVVFDSCHFIDCIPVRIRSSYNAYTPFDIIIRNCTFDITLRHHSLVNVMLLSTEANSRPELAARCWPNVTVENLTVNMPSLIRKINVIEPTGTLSECKKPVDYMRSIEINGLRSFRKGKPSRCDIYFTKKAFSTKESFHAVYKNLQNGNGRIIDEINKK